MKYSFITMLLQFLPYNKVKQLSLHFNSVTQSCRTLCNGLQHARIPCPSPTHRACSNQCPLSRWCHPTISSSVVPFSPCLQPFPASGSFQWVSYSHQVAKILEFQLQHQSFQWIFRTDFLYNWLVWSPCSPRDSRVFNTTVRKHQFISTQLSSWSNSHIHTWLLEETDLCQQSNVYAV